MGKVKILKVFQMMTSVIIVVVHRKTTFKLLFTNNLPFQQALNHCKWGESVELGKKGTEFNGFIDLNVVPQSFCMGSDDFKYNSQVVWTTFMSICLDRSIN